MKRKDPVNTNAAISDHLAAVYTARRARRAADPIAAAIDDWLAQLDRSDVRGADARVVGEHVEARHHLDGGVDHAWVILRSDLPTDPTAAGPALLDRLRDFEEAACRCGDPDDLARHIDAAHAARLSRQVVRDQDPAALYELLALLASARNS